MTSYRTVLFSAVVLVAAAMPAAPAVADSVPAVFKAVTVQAQPIAATRPATPAASETWVDLLTSVMFGILPIG